MIARVVRAVSTAHVAIGIGRTNTFDFIEVPLWFVAGLACVVVLRII